MQIITANFSDGAGNMSPSQTGPQTVNLNAINAVVPSTVQFTPGGGQTVTTNSFGGHQVSTYGPHSQPTGLQWEELLILLLLLGF
jgi:hypothetical protein